MSYKGFRSSLRSILALSGLVALIANFQNCSGGMGLNGGSGSGGLASLGDNFTAAYALVNPGYIDYIGVKTINNVKSFYISSSGAAFSPRGMNYTRICNGVNCLFDQAVYNSYQVEQAMLQMHQSGYNYVRVFLDGIDLDHGFGMSVPGVGTNFLHNVADFIARANNHGIRVMLTGAWTPPNYQPIIQQYQASHIGASNLGIMHLGWVAAQKQFYIDLLNGLKAISPNLLNGIMAFDLRNEAAFTLNQEPFSLTSGIFTFNGASYDMSNIWNRTQLTRDSAIYFVNTLLPAVKSVAPHILVGVSTGSPLWAGVASFDAGLGWYNNISEPYLSFDDRQLISDTAIDYVDIHSYPRLVFDAGTPFNGQAYNIATELAPQGIFPNATLALPLLMGEFGAFQTFYSSVGPAATALVSHLQNSCALGFSGWALWTWDAPSSGVWNATDSSNYINGLIAPAVLPSVCNNGTTTVSNPPPPVAAPVASTSTTSSATTSTSSSAPASWPVTRTGYSWDSGRNNFCYSNGNQMCVYGSHDGFLRDGGAAVISQGGSNPLYVGVSSDCTPSLPQCTK